MDQSNKFVGMSWIIFIFWSFSSNRGSRKWFFHLHSSSSKHFKRGGSRLFKPSNVLSSQPITQCILAGLPPQPNKKIRTSAKPRKTSYDWRATRFFICFSTSTTSNCGMRFTFSYWTVLHGSKNGLKKSSSRFLSLSKNILSQLVSCLSQKGSNK